MIAVSGANEVLALSRASLNLPPAATGTALADTEFLAALLRRVAGLHCPCSPTTLKTVMLQTLDSVVLITSELDSGIDNLIEALHGEGDLLELAHVTTSNVQTRGTWTFIAPPSFVMFPSGAARIFGLAPEESLPLPDDLRSRVRAVRTGRVIEPVANENLRIALVDAGLREQSIEAWRRLPPKVSAREFRDSIDLRLNRATHSGEIDQLRIYDPSQGAGRYVDRWVSPSNQSGRFVSRRAQAHGADMWGYVELVSGKPQRLVDFPLPGSHYRGCDEAWRLQMALDHESGHTHEYRVRPGNDDVSIDVFFPLPIWAQRRLEIVGTRVEAKRCLASFSLSNSVADGEFAFLEQALWMKKSVH